MADGFDFKALADVLGGAASGGTNTQQKDDALKLALANLVTSRQKSAATLPGTRLANSVKSSLATTAAPSTVKWNGPGSGLKGELPEYSGGVSGGLANLDPGTKQLAQQNIHDELLQQMQGGASGGNTDAAVPDVGKSSTLDKLTGAGGLVAGLASALGQGGSGSGGSFSGSQFKDLLNKILHPGGSDGGFTDVIKGDGVIQPDEGPSDLGPVDPSQFGTGEPTQDGRVSPPQGFANPQADMDPGFIQGLGPDWQTLQDQGAYA